MIADGITDGTEEFDKSQAISNETVTIIAAPEEDYEFQGLPS